MTDAERKWRETDEPARVRAEIGDMLTNASAHGNVISVFHNADGTGAKWVRRDDRLTRYVQAEIDRLKATTLPAEVIDALVGKEMSHR